MSIHKTEVIVLKTYDFRETSLIAHFYSLKYGRLDGILKGFRQGPKKFASTLEPFSCNEIVFYQSRNSGLHLVSQCDLKDNFANIRNNLKSGGYAAYMIELLSQLMPQEEKNTEVYLLVYRALTCLNHGQNAEKIASAFLIKLLKLIGFRPRLDSCIACDKDINTNAYFNPRQGGLLCPICATTESYSLNILKGTIASILHIEHSPFDKALRLEINGQIKKELTQILQGFVEFHLQLRPKSENFLAIFNRP